MKKKLNYLHFVLFFFIAVPCLTTSCWSDFENIPPAQLKPTISSIFPESGEPGTVITISGSKFGTDVSNVRVRFDNTTDATKIISVADTEIKVEAPEGFSDQTVNVQVFVLDQLLPSQYSEFYYTDRFRPAIASVPPTCFYNGTIVISGVNFSPVKEDNIVKFGEIEGTVTEATETSLTVTVPDLGVATSADITVTKLDLVSNTVSIDIDIDQNKVATTYDSWTTHVVRPGLIYKTTQFSLFGGDQRIYVLDVTPDATNILGIGFSTNDKSTVDMSRDYNAVAGINAGYFPFGGTVDKDPYIRINGNTVQAGHTGVNQLFTNSALIIHNNVATVRRFTESGTNLNLVAADIPVAEAENVIVCGPMLITDGEIDIVSPTNSHNTSLTARTGLGVTADGKRVFMVVIDSGDGFTGVTTFQLAKILQALGATNAMNFDGGGSSTMFVEGQGDNGRVNFPYGGTYQRPVRSVIYVK